MLRYKLYNFCAIFAAASAKTINTLTIHLSDTHKEYCFVLYHKH